MSHLHSLYIMIIARHCAATTYIFSTFHYIPELATKKTWTPHTLSALVFYRLAHILATYTRQCDRKKITIVIVYRMNQTILTNLESSSIVLSNRTNSWGGTEIDSRLPPRRTSDRTILAKDNCSYDKHDSII